MKWFKLEVIAHSRGEEYHLEGKKSYLFIFLRHEDIQFENIYDKIHDNDVSEFKIHFYVRRVPMGNLTEDDFLHFIRKKGTHIN